MSQSKSSLKKSFADQISPEIRHLLAKVNNFLGGQNIEAYLVGGLVRDVLLKRHTADIDIAIHADAMDMAPKIADLLKGRFVLLDDINKIGRVVIAREVDSKKYQQTLDFTSFEGSIEQDLARRDFTIDAMAVNLAQLMAGEVELTDPFNGLKDLKASSVRSVMDTAFESDPARLLRAVRIAAELCFTIEDNTEALIRKSCQLISGVAGERVREELLRILTIPADKQLISYLDKLGLLTALVPELAETKGVEQPKEHTWDVFQHSVNTVTAVDFLLRYGSWEYADKKVLNAVPWSDELARHFEQEVNSGSTKRLILKISALLHDINKPQTKSLDTSTGRTRFLGHPQEGAVAAAGILERLRFGSKEIKLVEKSIEHHMRPTQMSQEGLPTRRAIYRYFRDTGEAGIDILFLSLADHLAARGPNLNLANFAEHAKIAEYVITQKTREESLIHPRKLIDGHDIMNIFMVKPGPEIGEVLEAVREAQASGEITTREEALAYARERLTSKAE